jgi:hypothetical protein
MSDFYTAGSFWTAVAGAICTLIVGLLSTWYASRLAPKRRLWYRMADPVPLLVPDELPEGLEIRRGNQTLTDPCLVEVVLISNGRQAITTDMFNQGRPILANLGVPIVEVLKRKSYPSEQAVPDHRISDTTLEIGPSAFARRQQVTYSLLVEGDPKLDVIGNLPDVDVRQQPAMDPWVRRVAVSGSALTGIVVLSLIAYVHFTGAIAPSKLIAPNPAAAQAAAKLMLPSYGWQSPAQDSCLVKLWNRESGWTYNATNASGAYGIPQALPGSKMAVGNANSDWRTDAATQIRWGLGYIRSTYGSPCNAWASEQKNGYY